MEELTINWPDSKKGSARKMKKINKDELARSIWTLPNEPCDPTSTPQSDKAVTMEQVAARIAKYMMESDLTETSIDKLAKALDIMNKNYRLETNQSTEIKETITSTLHRIICQTGEGPALLAEPMEEAELI